MSPAISHDLLDSYLGDPRPKPVPAEPTACRGCGCELERLRRYAGYCRECVFGRSTATRSAPPPPKPSEELQSRYTVLREVKRKHRNGITERYVEIQCRCGSKPRLLQLSVWKRRRPLCCSVCKLAKINARGFEAEYAR